MLQKNLQQLLHCSMSEVLALTSYLQRLASVLKTASKRVAAIEQ
jgi:hypothetical protein